MYVQNPILMTKVKNAVKKELGDNAEFKLRNIILNGSKRGCSGFISNKENGVTVYINTEPSPLTSAKYMFRFALDTNDYTGCRNRFAGNFENLIGAVCELLESPEAYARDLKSFKKVS